MNMNIITMMAVAVDMSMNIITMTIAAVDMSITNTTTMSITTLQRIFRQTTRQKVYTIENLGCANCAAKMESRINQLEEVSDATITFATKQLRVSAKNPDALLNEIQEICAGIEVGVQVVEKKEQRQNTAQKRERKAEQKKELYTIIAGAVLFLGTVLVNEVMGYEDYSFPFFLAFAVSYLILGGEVLLSAGKNILKGQMFDENFLMSIATLGSFAIHKYPEAVGVMLFFRIGEFFEDVAVEKSRKSDQWRQWI